MFYLIWLLIKFTIWCYGMAASATVGGLLVPAAAAVSIPRSLIELSTTSMRVYRDAERVPELVIPAPEPGTADDPAYQGYFYGQVYRDFWYLVTRSAARCVNGTREWIVRSYRLWDELEAFWARSLSFCLMLGVGIGLVLGAGAAGLLLSMVAVLYLAVLVLATAAVMAAGGLLWLIESAVLTVRGITVECPDCHQRVSRPVFICSGRDGCGADHRRLVPGRFGVFRRICRCQRSLPTLLVLGKNALVAKCSLCGTQLPVRALSAPTLHVPVAGGPSVGKSVFMFSAVSRLHEQWKSDGMPSDFWASESFAAEFARARGALEDPGRMLKTTEARPRAYSLYLGDGLSRRVVYLYDSAGEVQVEADKLAEATFYQFTKGVVFCIDPFALHGVRRTVDRRTLDDLRSRATDPRLAVDAQVENLRERFKANGAGKLAISAAVVITKADALGPARVPHPYHDVDRAATSRAELSALVMRWLTEEGGRPDLVAALQNAFARVSFFVASHVDASTRRPLDSAENDDPAELLRWILSGR